SRLGPPVAVDAANPALAVTVDFDERLTAVRAVHQHGANPLDGELGCASQAWVQQVAHISRHGDELRGPLGHRLDRKLRLDLNRSPHTKYPALIPRVVRGEFRSQLRKKSHSVN